MLRRVFDLLFCNAENKVDMNLVHNFVMCILLGALLVSLLLR